MDLLGVGIFLKRKFEGSSSDIFDSHRDWLSSVGTEWTKDNNRSVEFASDWNLKPL
jgi:hypothetical protein